MAGPGVDMSQLSESQQEALQTYTAVTNQDPLAAVPLLQRCEWNVQIAIARFFDGEPVNDPVAEARASLPAPSARQTTNLQHDPTLNHSTSSSQPRAETVNRISTSSATETPYRPPFLLSLLLAPFSLTIRILTTLFRPLTYFLPAFLPRLLHRLTNPNPSARRPLPPSASTARFIREFTETYPSTTPLPFSTTGFNLTLDNAQSDLKYLLVFLISPSHDDTSSYIRQTLLSPEVTSFLTSQVPAHCLLWAGSVADPEPFAVATELGCTKCPFAALLSPTTSGSTGAFNTTSDMTVLTRLTGPLPPDEFLAKLTATISSAEASLTALRAERRERTAARTLREEQDAAYARSLAVDQARTAARREEAEHAARAEKEAQARQEEAERMRGLKKCWRKWRASRLEAEPSDGIRVGVRLAGGERLVRRFRKEQTLEEVYAWVHCHDLEGEDDAEMEKQTTSKPEKPQHYEHVYDFRLVSPMPRVVFGWDEGGSVGDRLGKGANLIVEPVGSEEEEGD